MDRCPATDHWFGPTESTGTSFPAFVHDVFYLPGHLAIQLLWRDDLFVSRIWQCPPVGGGVALLISGILWYCMAQVVVSVATAETRPRARSRNLSRGIGVRGPSHGHEHRSSP